MKKFLIVMLALTTAFMFSCNDTSGQTIKLYKTSSVNGTIDSTVTTQAFDTLANTTVKYMVSRSGALDGMASGKYTLSFYAKSLTGTPAAVNVVWEGSFDGYTWFRMTQVYGVDGLNCDTLRFTPSTTRTQYKIYSNPGTAKIVAAYATTAVFNMGFRVPFQRLRCIPSGTQTLLLDEFSIKSFL